MKGLRTNVGQDFDLKQKRHKGIGTKDFRYAHILESQKPDDLRAVTAETAELRLESEDNYKDIPSHARAEPEIVSAALPSSKV